jgi:hypothetical protein
MLLMKVKERGHIYLIVVVVGVDPLVMSEIASDN